MRPLDGERCAGPEGSGRVVVGLSTIPSRVGLLAPTLESLLEQTRVPDEILLPIPAFSRRESRGYTIPDDVLELAERGSVRILRVERDHGPGTKLIGCIDALAADDVFIAADDDLIYRPFFVEELAAAVRRSSGAASFYVYENRGLHIGQGADGFAMTGALARKCAAIVPLLEAHEALRRNDDYWISFLLRKHGVTPIDLSPACEQRGVDLVYENRHLPNGLLELEGGSRARLNRECHRLLFRFGAPTPAMRLRAAWRSVRGTARRTARILGSRSPGRSRRA